ncbi:glutathione S-transferase domain-containing protein [Rhizobium sp. P40RR-XXII]|uniref:glutathione S-transferase N-terminal domain-containing protein n=1 Tax=Rhizobium sp. P40RR-XXII TaxID=2726739 RepID=UPI001456D567|nr:glutathione S-transferase N-terminal domain-containing protein [Rhizobium sp. P40RR-XXII]NLS21124.1 glutathione S-transferase domain-containing protein [Rhizobium sp. P40RR-XXII]
MTKTTFKPVVYFKHNCPFCLKVRLYLLEAGMMEAVEIRDFVPGSKQEEDVRAELSPHLAKVSFPAAQLEDGRYIAESDDIIAFLAAKSGRDPAGLPVLGNYIEGALKPMLNLWEENVELKAAAA